MEINVGHVVAWREEGERLPHSIGTVKETDAIYHIHWNYKNPPYLQDRSTFTAYEVGSLIEDGLFFKLMRVYKVVSPRNGELHSACARGYSITYEPGEPVEGLYETPVLAFAQEMAARSFQRHIAPLTELWTAYTPKVEYIGWLAALSSHPKLGLWWSNEEYRMKIPQYLAPEWTVACPWVMLATRVAEVKV